MGCTEPEFPFFDLSPDTVFKTQTVMGLPMAAPGACKSRSATRAPTGSSNRKSSFASKGWRTTTSSRNCCWTRTATWAAFACWRRGRQATRAVSAPGNARDRIGKTRQQLRRQVVAHAGHDVDARALDARCQVVARSHQHQRIGLAVNDLRR